MAQQPRHQMNDIIPMVLFAILFIIIIAFSYVQAKQACDLGNGFGCQYARFWSR